MDDFLYIYIWSCLEM